MTEQVQALRLRPAVEADAAIIREMAFYAACWRPGQETQPRAPVPADDHVARYVEDWGRRGDLGVIAEIDGRRVGAAWLRLFAADRPGYGFIGVAIPELSIAVAPGRRGAGIGTALLSALLAAARAAGYEAVSLSVEPDNPALRLYRRAGFRRVYQAGGAWTMRRDV